MNEYDTDSSWPSSIAKPTTVDENAVDIVVEALVNKTYAEILNIVCDEIPNLKHLINLNTDAHAYSLVTLYCIVYVINETDDEILNSLGEAGLAEASLHILNYYENADRRDEIVLNTFMTKLGYIGGKYKKKYKRKASKRKVTKRKASKRKVTKRKASKRKVTKRKVTKRKAKKTRMRK